MVIALTGFTRLPIFYDSTGTKILGSKCRNKKFEKYVYSLKDQSIAIFALANLKYRSRFVISNEHIGRRAVNPSLKLQEYVPSHIYIYPDKEPDPITVNVHTLGIRLKGARKPVYVPLLYLKILTREEVNALFNATITKEITVEKYVKFAKELKIKIEKIKELAGSRILLKIRDPKIRKTYMVVIDNMGKVIDQNFCIEMHQQLYLPELIMLTRERETIHILPNFEY